VPGKKGISGPAGLADVAIPGEAEEAGDAAGTGLTAAGTGLGVAVVLAGTLPDVEGPTGDSARRSAASSEEPRGVERSIKLSVAPRLMTKTTTLVSSSTRRNMGGSPTAGVD
jgi:hypothetical protein